MGGWNPRILLIKKMIIFYAARGRSKRQGDFPLAKKDVALLAAARLWEKDSFLEMPLIYNEC